MKGSVFASERPPFTSNTSRLRISHTKISEEIGTGGGTPALFDAVDAGIGIDLTSPDFTMAISNVEKGSPAGAHTGRKTWSSTTPGGEALGMTVRSLEGKQFLLVEIGGFPEEVTPDFQGAHILYVEE